MKFSQMDLKKFAARVAAKIAAKVAARAATRAATRVAAPALALTLSLTVTGCVAAPPVPVWKLAVAGDGPGNPALLHDYQIKVSNLPKSRSGNRPQYEVFGNSYAVLDSAEAFSESGTASWYGAKFHGRPTASGEIYDMHKLTAAHKNLPLPTFVRVTRLDDGRSVVVKVNDRGPFVEDRIIDLSYAAAARLGMLEEGKAQVHIEALSHHLGQHKDDEVAIEMPQNSSTEPVVLAEPVPVHASAAVAEPLPVAVPIPVPATLPIALSEPAQPDISPAQADYVQVGAFGNADNAQALALRLENFSRLPVNTDFQSDRQLYRVRVGPLRGDDQINQAMQALSQAGLSGYLVTEPR